MDKNTDLEEFFLSGAEWTSTVTESEAQERIDLAVLPSDEKWKDAYRMFQDLFADIDTPIDQIIASNFTQHEMRLFMLSTYKILIAVQDDNTSRFYTLLLTRFQDVAPDIITKMTMLYFGLPIEPIDFSLTDMTYKMEIQEPEPPRYVADPPLHFLTAHKERNWGNGILIGRKDRPYPVPAQQPQHLLSSLPAGFLSSSPFQKEAILQEEKNTMLHLRGGELDEDSNWEMPGDNGDWGEGDDGDLSYVESNSEDGSVDVNEKEDNDDESLSCEVSNESIKVGDIEASYSEASDTESEEFVLPDSEWDNSINLYGFQGFASFLPGDQWTFEDAVKRLLSLGPQDSTKFSIVHFDKESNKVDIICDSFPLRPDSISLDYISKQDLTLGPSFFIKLENESAPDHWQPSEAELAAGVSTITWILDEGISPELTGAFSCCYLTFQAAGGSQLSQKEVSKWDFDQYHAYVETAFEVLLGLPLGCFHHAIFQIYSPSINSRTSLGYGFTAIKSSDVELLASNCGKEPLELTCAGLDDENELVFVLPCYYNISQLQRVWHSKHDISEALKIIRQIVSFAFGDSIKHLKYVRLLHGWKTLGPEVSRNQKYYSIPMSDDLPPSSVTHCASALSEIIADLDPFALLYPEWDEDRTFLYIQEPNGDNEADGRIQMPSLSSTVDEFRNKVFELMQTTGYKSSQVIRVSSGESFISIRPKIEDGPATTKDNAPSFFIGPQTTDEEWFRIRARIASPAATIQIVDSSKWNWRAEDQETSIWGPRYRRMAEAQATKKLKKKVSWAEVAEVIQERVTSEPSKSDGIRPSIEDEEPVETDHSDWDQTQPRKTKMKAASDSEKRKKTWATQRSIFDRHGLVPWPANSGIQLPMNAPSSEHLLRTGPRMPLVSKAILTPTEQGELQRVTWDLRNLCLNRTARCPYDGCNFAYRLDDENAMRKHLKASHRARKCMWCDETLYEHWNMTRVNRHVREKHKDELMKALGVGKAAIRRFDKEGTISIPLRRVKKRLGRLALALASEGAGLEKLKSQESRSEERPGFCDRCGRDVNYYSNTERVYHDNHCKPGILNSANCKFCTVCGKTVSLSVAEAYKSGKSNGQSNHCSHKVDDTNGPHCSRCGFNMSRLPQDGRTQHRKRCRGFGASSGRFCLYCGGEFQDTETQADWDRNKEHMVACFKKNPNVMGVLEEPEIAAFNQQQNNLRLQINAAMLDAINSEEEQDGKRRKDNVDNEDASQPKPAKRPEAATHGQVTADCSTGNISTARQRTAQDTGANAEIQAHTTSNLDSNRHSQETLRAILCQSISDYPQGESSPRPSTEAPDNASLQKLSSTSLNQRQSPDSTAQETEKEPELENRAESPLFVSSSSSEADSDTGSLFGEDVEQQHAQQSDDGESEDELLADPSKSKRQKPRGRKRTRLGDRDYRFESEDDDDSETDQEGQRSSPPRRSPSPNWRRILGPEDPEFEPSEEFYCSKCFRKAPKNHKRDRSPLGRKNEIELHHDPGRCCGIRRGIGSAKRLPNRSGWIPANLMPKPLSTLRRKFIRRYPVYARTVYPLNATNTNGSYYRSDPNNESNKAWWSIPWPPFRGPSPLPSGWEAPDVVDIPTAGRARQQFQLKPVLDPTYRLENNVRYSDDEDEDDVESDKDTNGKRKRRGKSSTARKSRKTTTNAETVAAPRPVKKRAPKTAKSQAALLRQEAQQFTEGESFTRRSTRKRHKSGKE